MGPERCFNQLCWILNYSHFMDRCCRFSGLAATTEWRVAFWGINMKFSPKVHTRLWVQLRRFQRCVYIFRWNGTLNYALVDEKLTGFIRVTMIIINNGRTCEDGIVYKNEIDIMNTCSERTDLFFYKSRAIFECNLYSFSRFE